jgi:uncharacterized protein YggE
MKYLSVIWVVFFLIVSGGITSDSIASQDKCESFPQLTVRGEATISVPADQIQMTIGIVTSGPAVEETLEQNTVKMRSVEEALKKIGLTEKECRTGHFQIQPKWAPRPSAPDQDWRHRIVAYTVNNHLKVKTKKLKLAGKIIAVSIQAGANQIDTIVFDLVDPRKFKSEAIAIATDNAKADALSLAEAAGVKLGAILSLQLEQAAEIPRRLRYAGLAEAAMATENSSPTIIPGDISVQASVMLVYQIIHGK